MAEYQDQFSEEIDVMEELQEPPMYRVLLHNDDYTPMDFVVIILQSVFKKPLEEATQIMLNIHHKGQGNCGAYPYEIAETKVEQVRTQARQEGFPLLCTMEEA